MRNIVYVIYQFFCVISNFGKFVKVWFELNLKLGQYKQK
jgi:hypothetical protein